SRMDGRTLLGLEAQEDGPIAGRRGLLPYCVEVKGVAGRIERGLREDAVEFGMPARVVSDLADIFGWDVDVAGGLRPGDEFRVVYEDIWQTGGTRPEPGNVLGAQIVSRGRATTAIFFEDADGNGGYYRPSGDALSRTCLRYPLELPEITSAFSLLRLHPILHIFRPHLGVDFAAPRGTPVRAVGDGTVSYAGRLKELGRCVRIDHARALTSSYGHLSGIAPGVQAGAPVRRGQLIGYVGATGLAPRPRLFAHRGASGLFPENTLDAFAAGLGAGAERLELDVHATADGQVVVIHDETLERTTDGTGFVRALPLAALQRLDAGYRFRA